TLDSGWDFYSSPALSPDGMRLAWLSWRHPYMPWISTFLQVAELDPEGALKNRQTIAGGEQVSLLQPRWSPDGTLFFISDKTDFWNLHRWNGSTVEAVLPRDAEFGAPQWQFAASTYAFVSRETMIYSFTRNGMWFLGRLELPTLSARDYPTEFASVSGVRAAGGAVVMRCSTPTSAAAIATFDIEAGKIEEIKYSVPPESYQKFQPYFSAPQSIRFPTDGRETAYGFYYPAQNPDWQAETSEKPPLIVKSHGGPTPAAPPGRDLSPPVWTRPRVCGARRELSRQQRLRPQVPRQAQRPVGRGRCSGLHRGREVPGGSRRRRCRKAHRHRRQRRRLHHAVRAHVPSRFRRRRELLWRERSRCARGRDPQVRIALSRLAHRALSARPRALPPPVAP